ncbi:hypothetical protein BT63DRAFT_119218 [Microthyrium microscopicum]|uniref:Fe2OG dioxygenase domain-containing protein n=1 Tax=Microthyrium microscopicum TaxID=703497 RepID=A0A6A6TWW7_9PEZI|nr:hypothetical protein BT63DRAFT_119218 [Microthyrium microscopicum]
MAISTSPASLLQYTLLIIPTYIFILSPLSTILFSAPSLPPANSLDPNNTLVLPSPSLSCPNHTYPIHLLSRSPLILYIPSFLTPNERDHITSLANPLYAQSPIYAGTQASIDMSIRNSSRAQLPRDDIVQCIESRALALQGWPVDTYVERLWAQRYEAGGHYSHHFDWAGELSARGGGRVSTLMVYVACEGCEGGGTEFPRLEKPKGAEWCEYIECADGEEEEERTGVTFRPVAGSAVYWENFKPDGRGWEELWHAGMPVRKGTKIGLNIWSWYQPGFREIFDKRLVEAEKEEL